MTSENLIELFEKGLEFGKHFKANTQPIGGRYMEFSYGLSDRIATIGYRGLGTISLLCEFDHTDYYENNLDRPHFGICYYIKYDASIEGIKPFKFYIGGEIFSNLLKRFRVFERVEAHKKELDRMSEFQKRMEKIEAEYDVSVSATNRHIITEKHIRNHKTF